MEVQCRDCGEGITILEFVKTHPADDVAEALDDAFWQLTELMERHNINVEKVGNNE